MVAIGFTVFREKIESGEKTQTIRIYSKKRWDAIVHKRKLQLYWKLRTKETELIKEVTVKELLKIKFTREGIYEYKEGEWIYMSPEEVHELANRDGFESSEKMYDWFVKKYGDAIWNKELMVIRW